MKILVYVSEKCMIFFCIDQPISMYEGKKRVRGWRDSSALKILQKTQLQSPAPLYLTAQSPRNTSGLYGHLCTHTPTAPHTYI